MRKNSLYIGLPLPSIPSELPPSPWSEKVYAFSDIIIYTNTVSGDCNALTTSEIALTFTFPANREGLRFFDFLKCMNTILQGFQMTATVL